MYLKYWSLWSHPFDERPDPGWYYASAQHTAMLLKLRCVVRQRLPIALLTGAPGCGKSMIAGVLTDETARETYVTVHLRFSPASVSGVVRAVLEELQRGGASRLGKREGADRSKELIESLQAQLARRAEARQHVVVLLDAADELPEREWRALIDTLRGMRIRETPALTALIIGSSDLLLRARRLGSQAELFPQLVLDPMAPTDTAKYIRHRLRLAGGDSSIFVPGTIDLIHELSSGVPRRINRIASLCLIGGFAQGCKVIDQSLVWHAQEELHMLSPTRTATASAPRRWRMLAHQEIGPQNPSQQATRISASDN